MNNRDQVAALVQEGLSVYDDLRKKREVPCRLLELAHQTERDLVQLEARRESINGALRKLGYHDVGHAKGELAKSDV